MSVVIWHNPGCSTSRRVLAMLEAAGLQPEVVPYLERGWTAAELRALFAAAGMTAAEALRRKEPLALSLGLPAEDGPVAEAAVIAAMVAHPVLVERPFVQSARGTRLCRPAETVAALIG